MKKSKKNYVETVIEVPIHNLKWDIIFASEKCKELNHEEVGVCCGITYKCDLKIYINTALKKDLMIRTLRHELTHAYIWTYGLNQFTCWNEETICDFVETYANEITEHANHLYEIYYADVNNLPVPDGAEECE